MRGFHARLHPVEGQNSAFLGANHPQEAASDLKNFLSEAHWLHLSPDILRAHLLVLMNLFTSFHGQSQEQGIGSQPEGLHPLLVDVTHAETKEGLERGINTFLKTFLLTLNSGSWTCPPLSVAPWPMWMSTMLKNLPGRRG